VDWIKITIENRGYSQMQDLPELERYMPGRLIADPRAAEVRRLGSQSQDKGLNRHEHIAMSTSP